MRSSNEELGQRTASKEIKTIHVSSARYIGVFSFLLMNANCDHLGTYQSENLGNTASKAENLNRFWWSESVLTFNVWIR